MEPWLVYPDPPPPELVQTLELAGHAWKAVADEVAVGRIDADAGWRGAVVVLGDQPETGLAVCRALRKRDVPIEPVLLLVRGAGLADLELRDDLYDDFCLDPFHPRELEARLRHLLPDAVFVSARRGDGIERLRARIAELLPRPDVDVDLLLPYTEGSLAARVHAEGEVLAEEHTADGTLLHARVGAELAAAVLPFARGGAGR